MDNVIVNTENRNGNIFVTYINGNIICNLSSTQARHEIEALLECDAPKIILNIKDVRYIDSFSFGWLAAIFKRAKAKNGIFVISDPNLNMMNLFKMTQFDQVVPIYESEEKALEALQ
jgi:anti-anti-sigma factor